MKNYIEYINENVCKYKQRRFSNPKNKKYFRIMKVTVVTPETKDFRYDVGPCVFLAGPCADARNWHTEVAKCFERMESDQQIVLFVPKNPNFKNLEEQADWETYHLNYAYSNGLIAFYLANKERASLNRGYGRTTRFELGEWLAKYKYMNPMKNHFKEEMLLTIGIEDDFEGMDYIIHRLKDYQIENCTNNVKNFCEEIYKKLFNRQYVK